MFISLSDQTKKFHPQITSIKSSFRSSNNLLLRNRLTKSHFSLSDVSSSEGVIGKNIDRKSQQKNRRSLNMKAKGRWKKETSLILRYESEGSIVKETQKLIVPKVSLMKNRVGSVPLFRQRGQFNSETKRNTNKFKLVFNEPKFRKTFSEHKINSVNKKIESAQKHNKMLKSIQIMEEKISIENKPISKGIIIQPQKIIKLSKNLLKNINMYFNMYDSSRKVGSILKSFDGFNQTVQNIFFLKGSHIQAKKIKQEKQITNNFWVFQEESLRPEFFGEQDFNLYNSLQNYCLKMQRSFSSISKAFNQFESKKFAKLRSQLPQNQLSGSQAKQIISFINARKRHNQDRRENTLSKLQLMGVKFDVRQRNREFVIREKQKILGKYFGS